MSANVQIAVESPMGEVTVSQSAGRLQSISYGAEIEHSYLVDALAMAINRVAAAYGVNPPDLADALSAATESENRL